jgi:GxxExxY protein
MSKLLHQDITDTIINSFYHVFNELGHGFLEKVYQKSLALELTYRGLDVSIEHMIPVKYKGIIVGEYFADIIVENKIIIEVKVIENISKIHESQIINYLKASEIQVGFIMNFYKEPEFKRLIHSNPKK